MSETHEEQNGAGGIAVIDEVALAEQARKDRKPIPAGNGLLAPARWEMFGRIANTVAGTEFVPAGLRGKPAAVMACLLYGDALGLHPSVALTEVHIVDGKPTMSATLMVGKIRMAGHKLRRKEIRAEPDAEFPEGRFIGVRAFGARADDGTEDDFTFTLDMAGRAGLMTKNNWKNYPEAMCWARAVSQLSRMLFPDVFLGSSAYTSEELGLDDTDEYGVPVAAVVSGGVAAAVPSGPAPEQPHTVAAPETAADEPEEAAGEVVEEAADVEVPLETEDAEVLEPWSPLDDRSPTDAEYADAQAVLAADRGDGTGTMLTQEERELLEMLVAVYEADVADTGAAAPPQTAEEVAKGNIAVILPLVEAAVGRGDHEFIAGVLNHETQKASPRQRLVDSLQAKLAEARLNAGVPAPSPGPAPFEAPASVLLPFDETNHDGKVLWLRGALGFIAELDPKPEWKHDAVILSANRIWKLEVTTIAELDDDHLGKVWSAVPAEIRDMLGKQEREAIVRAIEQAGIGE